MMGTTQRNSPSFIVGLLVIMLAAGVGARPTYAHDHREPRSVLIATGGRQQGQVIWSGWLRGEGGNLCVGTDRDATYGFPSAVQHDLNETVRLRFFKKQRPDTTDIHAYRVVLLDQPVDDGEEVEHVIKRVTLPTGERVWDAVFRPVVAGDYYLDVIAGWRDRDCNGEQLQQIRWTFHLSSY